MALTSTSTAPVVETLPPSSDSVLRLLVAISSVKPTAATPVATLTASGAMSARIPLAVTVTPLLPMLTVP